MENLLGEHWLERYPETLTQKEKADIKSALLKSLATGSLTLAHYLQNLKVLSAYPES